MKQFTLNLDKKWRKNLPIHSGMRKFLLGILLVSLFVGIVGCGNLEEDVVDSHSWEITQYGPRDINSNFYTIYNKENGLIVIDGGWTEDAAYVREIINSFGVPVEAWILTHPHQDHVGAFNALYPELNEIVINNIYTVDMASPEECLAVASWDSVDAYNNFLALDIPNLHYVYSGDIFTICGLEIEILSAYDENVENLSKDYLNDGSMMF